MSAPLVVLGDALLDVDVDGRVTRLCPDAPVPVLDAEAERERPGGAALAALLAALGSSRPVRLVAPLGDDADSRRVRALLDGLVEVVPLPAGGSLPVKSRMLAGERPLLRLDRGGLDGGPWEEAALAAAREALDGAGGVLVADYGRGVTADPGVRELLTRAARRVPVVWDPHPRGADPVPGVTLATPNLDEARAAAGGSGASDDWFTTASRAAAALRGVWRAESVTVTAGARGAVLHGGGGLVVVPAEAATGGDPCGAGDRFAGAAALALAAGRTADEAVSDAVAAAGSFVAGGGAGAVRRDADGWHAPGLDSSEGALRSTRSAEGAPRQSADPGPDSTEGALRSTRSAEGAPRRNGQHRDGDRASAVVHAARARGARVVATGGCFDLLHAGHARTLGAARELAGEDGVLVVCLNSDASVRRLKGPARPIVGQADRAELLAALACVDAVAVFDEDGPQTVLAHLRPDVWVKGGDYAADDLPEAGLVRSWGGEVVAVPYHAGRSSTRLAAAAGVGAADHHQEGPS